MNRRAMLRQTALAAAATVSARLSMADAAGRSAAARSRRGMVATVHPLATDAGLAALARGGNAIDAAIAAALTLGVVDQHNSGLGGGCFILIRDRRSQLTVIDGRETAPANATRDMYVAQGKPQPALSQTGPLAVATPGALAAYDAALRSGGRLPLKDLLLPAAEIAEAGFPLDRIYAGNIRATHQALAQFEASRKLLLAEDGSPLPEGAVLKQPDLARTYRAIAEQGIDWFYRGEFAQAVGRWMRENGGILQAADFAAYQPQQPKPLVTRFRGRKIVGVPPPSSGGVHVAQILNILERFDLRDIRRRDPAQFVHIVAEAMKLAFADRAHWLGDPQFARVPRGLVDAAYGKELAARIDPHKATAVAGHGTPPEAETDLFGKHTTHLVAADADGTWVSLTQTINTSFGSKVVVPGTGVFLNNEMDDFSIFPGQPNAFGLVGSDANAVAPGKRPLSSMSPTIVLDLDGGPVLALGAAGGPTIISQVVLGIVRQIELGLSEEEALAQPRFHHQWLPDELRVEEGLAAEIFKGLEARGHKLKPVARIGVTQLVRWDARAEEFIGVHDPRVPGKAAGP